MNYFFSGADFETFWFNSPDFEHHILRYRDQRGYELRTVRMANDTVIFDDNPLVVEEADILALRADALPFLR